MIPKMMFKNLDLMHVFQNVNVFNLMLSVRNDVTI